MCEVGSSRNPLAMVHIIDDDANLRVPLLNCFEPIGMRATAFEGAAHPVCRLRRAYLRRGRSGSFGILRRWPLKSQTAERLTFV
jgi:hypothetical protein